MDSRRAAPKILSAAFLAGPFEQEGALGRISAVTNAPQREIAALARRVVERFGTKARPRASRVERFIREDDGFRQFSTKEGFEVRPEVQFPRQMCPTPGPPATWPVPPIETIGSLADLLNLTGSELGWFADARGLERKVPSEALRHYRYQWIHKRDGSARLIEAPKARLKAIQRFLLKSIIERIPPHEAAHGFRDGRSIRSFTATHIKREVVLKLDLKDFFPSLTRGRVLAIFLTAGYPERVAQLLTGLCTNSTPALVLGECPAAKNYRLRAIYGQPHLPQGAPSSPGLANLCAFRLDCRLAGLARAAEADYTRYADDLVFSGDAGFARGIQRFYIAVCRVALEEGFEVHTRKTRIMRRSVSQRAAGLVLNEKANVSRSDYDEMKAVLHNCLKKGPASQNRAGVGDFRGHLSGRIAHVEQFNIQRGAKLRGLFEAIHWNQGT